MTSDNFSKVKRVQQHEQHPSLYYLLPESVKRRCRALKRIAIELESLEIRFRIERKMIREKFCTIFNHDEQVQGKHYPTVHSYPLEVITEKADQLKNIVVDSPLYNMIQPYLSAHARAMSSLMEKVERKCHEIMTHLANVDFELESYQQTVDNYHREIEKSLFNYSAALTTLYEKRLSIVIGQYEPDNSDCTLPEYLAYSRKPKYYETERILRERHSINSTPEGMLEGTIPGIPEFWLQSMLIVLRDLEVVVDADSMLLTYLMDVRFFYNCRRVLNEPGERGSRANLNSDLREQKLVFIFAKNPYFENMVLEKTIYLDMSGKTGKRAHDGLYITERVGSIMNWSSLVTRFEPLSSKFRAVQTSTPLSSAPSTSITPDRHQQQQTPPPPMTTPIATAITTRSRAARAARAVKATKVAKAARSTRVTRITEPIKNNSLSPVTGRGDISSCRASEPYSTLTGKSPAPQVVAKKTGARVRSFFNFFSDLGLTYENSPIDDLDYEVFARFRDFMVGHAVVAYTRGNLYGFECEHRTNELGKANVTTMIRYMDSLFTC